MDATAEPLALIAKLIFGFLTENIWPIVLVISIIIFREPLSNLLKRIITFSFSYGGAKGDLRASAPETQEAEKEEITAIEEKRKIEKVPTGEKQIEAKKNENWFSTMRNAFLEKDFQKATKIFEEYFRSETDVDKRIQNESLYLYFLYSKAGDRSAIIRLQRLIKTSESGKSKSDPLLWLSLCYQYSKNYNEAERLWVSAINDATDEAEKTGFIRSLAYVYKNKNQYDKAIPLLETRLREVKTDEEKSIIYKTISDIQKERGNDLISALALEKVIEYDTDDKERLFDAAYSQANAELLLLAINNYDTLITLAGC